MLTIGAVFVILLALTSCTPQQLAYFHTLDKPEQVKVIVEIQRQQAETQFYLGIIAAEERRAIQLHPFLTCVRHHESDRGPYPHTNGYTAQNPYSSASGAYQFSDATWRTASAAAGHGGYARASYAPPSVQDAVAYHRAITMGERYHWNGTGC